MFNLAADLRVVSPPGSIYLTYRAAVNLVR